MKNTTWTSSPRRSAPDGSNPAYTYYGPYSLEIYDLGVTQRQLGFSGQTCTDGVCTGGTVTYSEGYGIKASNICVNNRCFNDPRFPGLHLSGYGTNETHIVSVGNNPSTKNLSQAAAFRVDNRSNSPTAKFQLDQIGAFVHSMTGGSIPQAAIHAHGSGGTPGTKLFDLEPIYNDDAHFDYFVAPRDAQVLTKSTNYWVVFSEGGSGSNASFKLYATAKPTEDDDSHANWPVADASFTKDDDGTSAWNATRSGDTVDGTGVIVQIKVYAGVAP